MTEEDTTQRRGKLGGILISLLVAIGGAIGGGFVTFAYNQWYNIPKVTYQIFPSYMLPSPLNGSQVEYIFIQNSGAASATNLIISVVTSGPIVSEAMNTFEQWQLMEPWQNQTRFKFSQPRLARGDYITITLIISTKESEPISNVYIVYDQGMAVKEEVAQTPWILITLILVVVIIILIIGILLAYLRGRMSALRDYITYTELGKDEKKVKKTRS